MLPPPEVVARGQSAILNYLRDYDSIQQRQMLVIGAGGIGTMAVFTLMWRWKMRQGKAKKKRS